MNIYEKLLAIQVELKAPKNQYNGFGKYNYRNCEDVLEAVKPLCNKHKTVCLLSDDVVYVEGRHYVKATASLYDCEHGDCVPITVTAYAREEETKKGMDGSQVTGASSSYARKYALNGLFDIDDTKDSDGTNQGETANKRGQTQSKLQAESKDGADGFKPEDYKCAVCGKVVDKKLFDQTLKAYGMPLCSADCKKTLVKAGEILNA